MPLMLHHRQIKALEARIAELEAKPPTPEYKGIYEDGLVYPRGTLTTRAGSLWLATRETATTPGSGPASGWQLIVKNGAFREDR